MNIFMHLELKMRAGILVIILCFLFPSGSTSQNIWQQTYGIKNRFDIINSTKSTYDKGFILNLESSSETPNEFFSWLVKTDINGNILWSKSFYDPEILFLVKSIDVTVNGDVVLTGATEQFDDEGDVFIMRLNSCGEKVWCKVIRYNNMNYGYRVKIRNDGNYALYTRYAAPSSYKSDKLWIIDTNGTVVNSFYIIPPNTHPNIGGPLIEDFVITSDEGFLFSGHCYFPLDTVNPNMWRLQHLLVKFDSTGNEQWIRPQFIDSNHVGVLMSTAELNEVFYTVGYDYAAVKTTDSKGYISDPYNGKFDLTGNLLYEKVLHPDTMFNFLYYIQPVSNGTLIQTGKVTHDTMGDPPYYMGVFKTDTMFNILNYLQNDTGSVTNECITASIDGKFLITGYCPPESSYTEVDGLAIKVNSDLEYDSLYSFPFVYDSLCPFPILTDTIDCDCDIITGYGEPVKVEERYHLHIYPNPADERVHIRLNDVMGTVDMQGEKLVMYDLFGRRILERDFVKETGLNLVGVTSGIYILVVEYKGVILAREKLIVL